MDDSGQAYVTGFTYSDDFPVTSGAAYPDYASSEDAFVARLSADGTALGYSTYLGGNGGDRGRGIAVDGSGQAYITGRTESSDFPVTAGAAAPGLANWRDAFVARLSADGTALGYSTYLGGNSDEEGNGIAVDDSGQAYITGYTWSTDFPVTAGAAYPSIAGDSDIFVAKLNATGSALGYSTYLGGNGGDRGRGIAVDGSGQVYVTGQTSSFNFPVTANAAYPAYPGNDDAFVAKLNAAGSALDYATYLGGSYDDFSLGIAVDFRGLAYVTGTTGSNDFPTRYAPYPARVANTDAFVAALSPDGGGLVYAIFVGGSEYEEGTGLALDAGGNAYVTGYTGSNDFPTSAGAVDTNFDYSGEAFVAKFTIDGKLLLVTRTGAGSGLVSSTLPDGTIDCGPVCSAIYPTSTTAVRLLAGTQPLSTFGGWGGDCASAGTSLTCNLTLTGDKTVSARFEPRTDDVAISQGLDLDQSQPGIDWYQAGSAPWFAQDRVTQDGIDAAQSGAIGDGQSSELEATLTGPAYLSFWWKVSSEQGWDYLTFYLDGVEQAAITGKTDWAQVFINIPAGSHSLTWAYEKDANGQAGQDAGWLDQVVFDNADRTLVIDPPVGGTISGATSGSYPLGTALTLVAEVGAGHYFAGWGGDCADAGLANTCELTLYTDKHVSASFPALLQGEATDVAAGDRHSCAVADGGVRCWGANGSGQLGNGSTLDSPVPVQAIPAGSGATAVAAGYSHSCAIVNGGVMCWGDGGSGRLGNGTYESSSTPVQTIPAGSGASAVAAGGQHSCAVVNGGVKCWGAGWSGQLGNGSNNNSSTPVQAIAAGKGVTAIAAEEGHSCAVVNGGVKCWGAGWSGQLGNGTYESSSTPVQAIPAGSGASAVAAGGQHSCAVVAGGVQCWGNGASGRLGNGTYDGSSSTPVQTIAAGNGATAVAAGGSHSCAVVAGGVQCWGDGWSGQLGNGSFDFNFLTPVLAIPAGSGASDIAAGGNHSCAVVAGGVHCWGNNGSGQLGDGTQDRNARPQPVIGLASDLGPGIPVTATAGPGGSISPMWVNVPSGETATFTLSLDPGHSIASVTGCDGSLSGFSYTTGAITAPCAVSATFSANSYAITTNANPEVGGTVTCDPNPVAYGGGSRCTARVASGYGFVNWGGDCSGSSPTCALSTITGPREVTANFVDLSATLAVTHSAPAYPAGGLLRVNARLNDSSGATPLSLLWRPTLPAGWVLTSVTGDGSPELSPDASEILFKGSLTAMPLDFSFQIAVPAGASGPQTIGAIVEYQNSGMTNPVTLAADPNPMTLDGGGYHSADYRNPRWQIDSTEANRVLAYWRAAAYHVEPTGDDGYASGTGSTERNRHSADYRDPFWQIDSSEANRVLAYWRAAAYHADPTGDDGFAAGTLASGLEVEVPNTAPTATHSAPSYVPGGTLTVTNSLDPPADGTLLGLLWTPSLPAGWTISVVSGDAAPEVGPDGAILFTATSLTTKPLQFTYQVTVPTGTTGSQNLSAQVEYLMNGAINPQSLSAQPQPLVLAMSAGQDLTIAGADVPTTGAKTFNASGKITVLGDVIVRSGVQVTLNAGKKIAFLPGFKVNAGGRLSARIGSAP